MCVWGGGGGGDCLGVKDYLSVFEMTVIDRLG